MVGRSKILVLSVLFAGALTAAAPAVAGAQSETIFFQHDDSLDGTPQERQSGYFQAVPPDTAAQPGDQRGATIDFLEALDADNDFTPPDPALTYETFPFTVAPGTTNGSFTVEVTWANPAIDLDLYVYRRRPNGTLDPTPVAQSATVSDPETATYTPATVDTPVEPGEYVIFVDNWCSNDADPTSVELLDLNAQQCAIGDYADEDDFHGRVTFAPLVLQNRLPQATISGPDTGTVGSTLTFTAGATDSDGSVVRYSFDLDGDGNFEYDAASSNTASRFYERAGTFNVGVRVIDDRGGVGYASKLVTITPAPGGPGTAQPLPARQLIRSFALNRPVFGGRNRRSLVVRYRLREAANVEVTLMRGSRRVRRLFRGQREANRTYRLTVRPRGLRRGRYKVRIAVQTADGRRKVAVVHARRL